MQVVCWLAVGGGWHLLNQRPAGHPRPAAYRSNDSTRVPNPGDEDTAPVSPLSACGVVFVVVDDAADVLLEKNASSRRDSRQ